MALKVKKAWSFATQVWLILGAIWLGWAILWLFPLAAWLSAPKQWPFGSDLGVFGRWSWLSRSGPQQQEDGSTFSPVRVLVGLDLTACLWRPLTA